MSKTDAQTELVPRLRFPEFRDSEGWASLTVADAAKTVTPPKKLKTSQYDEIGTYPVIDQSPDAICGWTDDKEAVIREPLPVIVFGDHTCVIKKAEAPFAQGADGIKILAGRNGFDTAFLYQLLCSRPLKSESYKRHFTKLKLVGTPRPPSPAEQRKISDCLGSLDDLIAAEGRMLEALRDHKNGLMQQLFPREGETRPRIRFPEFQDAPEWSQRTLGNEGELLTSLSGKTAADFDDGDARFIPYSNVFESTFTNTTALRAVDVGPDESQNAVCKGDLFFTVSSETQKDAGMSSVLLEDLDNCYLNSFCALFRFYDDNRLNTYFAGYLFRSQRVRSYLEANAQGAIRYNISRGVFRDLAFLVPEPSEQDAIADCLASLDAMIAVQAEKLDGLRTHKRGLMQQLFPSPEDAEA